MDQEKDKLEVKRALITRNKDEISKAWIAYFKKYHYETVEEPVKETAYSTFNGKLPTL